MELVTPASLGLRPSLHAAARRMETLAALYDKVNRTEPAILRALVCSGASTKRLPRRKFHADDGAMPPL